MSCVTSDWHYAARSCSNLSFYSVPKGIKQGFSAAVEPNEVTGLSVCVWVCCVWVAELIKLWAGFYTVLFSWQFHLNAYPKWRRILWEHLAGFLKWLAMLCFVVLSLRGRERLQHGGQPWRGTVSAASNTSCLSSISSSLWVFFWSSQTHFIGYLWSQCKSNWFKMGFWLPPACLTNGATFAFH